MRIDHFQINTHYRFMNKLLIRRKLQILLYFQFFTKLKVNKIAARWPAKAMAHCFSLSKKGS